MSGNLGVILIGNIGNSEGWDSKLGGSLKFNELLFSIMFLLRNINIPRGSRDSFRTPLGFKSLIFKAKLGTGSTNHVLYDPYHQQSFIWSCPRGKTHTARSASEASSSSSKILCISPIVGI